MSWVAVIWSVAAGACLTLGVVHFLVWCWDRALGASLWFAGVAFSVAVLAGIASPISCVQRSGWRSARTGVMFDQRLMA